MLFNLQEDRGATVSVYVVPDSAGTIPFIRVTTEGRELLVLRANEGIAALVQAGRHASGLCGFRLDDGLIPDLAGYTHLEIAEAETDILVYRRPLPNMVADTNLFRLETHLLPLWRLDEKFKNCFQHWHKGIDRFGRETATQAFCLNGATSSYVSGRLLYKTYEFYLNKGVKTIAMLRDPYDELAERLIFLKNIGSWAGEVLGARDAITFAPVVESLADVDAFDEAFCKRFFKKTANKTLLTLANPLVRQLTAATPDEMPRRASVAAALDVLSSFELIGLRSACTAFQSGLAELTGLAETELPHIEEYARVTNLGAYLRGNRHAEALLEKDLETFHILADAFDASDAKTDALAQPTARARGLQALGSGYADGR